MTGGPPELTCREVVEIVTDYLEGSMTVADRVRFEEHISNCDGCENYLHQIRETVRVSGALTEEMVPDHMRDLLLSAFRDWKRGR